LEWLTSGSPRFARIHTDRTGSSSPAFVSAQDKKPMSRLPSFIELLECLIARSDTSKLSRFQDEALAAASLHFDSAAWCLGVIETGVPTVQVAHLFRQPPEAIANWDSIKQHGFFPGLFRVFWARSCAPTAKVRLGVPDSTPGPGSFRGCRFTETTQLGRFSSRSAS
jgi:hypothetical protein